MTIRPGINDPMLQSKKFVAFLISEFTWKILIGMVLFWGKGAMESDTFIVLMTIITAGVVEVGYILGQAALERYIHLAEVGITKKDDPEPEPPAPEPDKKDTP